MPSEDRIAALLERMLETTQNVFILQALEAGVRGEDIRSLLRVDKWRVTNVSKIRPRPKPDEPLASRIPDKRRNDGSRRRSSH
jgi:hypothetical protein